MDFLDISLWLSYLPAVEAFISTSIHTAEATGLPKEQKEAMVLTGLEQLINTWPLTDAQKASTASILAYAKLAITAQVMIMNLVGLFKHAPATPPVVVPPVVDNTAKKKELGDRIAKIKERITALQAKPARTSDEETQLTNKTATLKQVEADLAALK